MSFQYPQFLWALSLTIIPILIHLFNLQKYKTIYFSDISLLKSIQTESKKKSKIRNFLLLISRVFLISLLVLAFSRPTFNSQLDLNNLNNTTIGIYLDNSYSMSRTKNNQSLFEIAKGDAINLINSYSDETKFYILSNSRSTNKSYLLNKKQAKKHIQNITYSNINMNLNQLILNQKEQFKSDPIFSYWFTDLQKIRFNYTTTLNIPDSSQFLVSLYQEKNQNNISIDSVWFAEKDRKVLTEDEIFIKVKNWNPFESEIQLKLVINKNEIVTQKLVNLKKYEDKTISIKYIIKENGIKKGELTINNDINNVLKYDDKLSFVYSTYDQYKVNYLYSDSNFNEHAFRTLFSTLEEVAFNSINITDGFNKDDLDGNLIILDEINDIPKKLRQQIENQNIIFIPPFYSNKDFKNVNLFLKSYGILINKNPNHIYRLNEKSMETPFFKNVFKKIDKNIDLPKFKMSYDISFSDKYESLMKFENDDDFLIECYKNEMSLYLFTSSLRSENSNIKNHAIFVPTILKIKENTSVNQKLYYHIDDIQPIAIGQNFNSENITISNSERDFSIYPLTKFINGSNVIYANNQLENEGFYDISKGDSIIKTISLNSNREESFLETFEFDDFKSLIEENEIASLVTLYKSNDVNNSVDHLSIPKHNDYWMYFIVLAFIFVILEILIIRYYEKPI